MIGTFQCVVLDCPHPLELARFYEVLLGGEVNRPDPRWSTDDHWATLHLPDGQVIAFQHAPDHRPPSWPDPGPPRQFHLDIDVPDLDAGEREVLAAGAVLLERGAADRGWRVYRDPAGHPFCLVTG
jgi:hypothetical protein